MTAATRDRATPRPGATTNLYVPASVDDVRRRLGRLRPDSAAEWGRMNVAQMLAHCAAAMELALGDVTVPRSLIGRVFGGWVRRVMIDGGAPMRRNSPTDRRMVVADAREFAAERARLLALIDRFATGGPAACTTHPHFFFGRLTPVQWATLMYQHLDHHLQQFGA